MLGFAHTIEKLQGLAGCSKGWRTMPNNAQAIGLQPILYISSEGSNEGGGGGGLQFPPEFTSHFTISKEVYNGLISTFTYWAKSITVDALKVSTSIIGMLL